MRSDERARERWFDGELDRLVAGLPAGDDAARFESDLTAAARTLLGLHARQVARPDEAFVKRLEESLMQRRDRGVSMAAVTARLPFEQSPSIPTGRTIGRRRDDRRGRGTPSRWPAWIELTVAAALILVLVTAAFGRDALFGSHQSSNNATGIPTPTAVPEGMYRGDAAHTGVMPGPGPEGEPGLLWRFDYHELLPVSIVSSGSPTLAGGTLYVSQSDPGIVTAIDAVTGQRRWQSTVGMMGATSPAVAGGLVFVEAAGRPMGGSDTDYLIALDAATGTERWRYESGRIEDSSPAVANGTVYVATADGSLRAIDALTGSERWRFDLTAPDPASPRPKTVDRYAIPSAPVSPAVADGIVYATSREGVLFAVDAVTGRQRWRFQSDANYFQTPAVAGGQVFLVVELSTRDPAADNSSAWVYALDARTGAENWVWHDGLTGRPPAVANGMVYLATVTRSDHQITALEAATGKAVWTSVDAGDGSAPVVVGTTIYATSGDGGLYAIDGATGATRWRVDLGSAFTSEPVVADGRVIVAAGGKLFAIGGSEAEIGTPVATPIVDGDASGLTPCTVRPRQESELTPGGTPSADLVPERPDWKKSGSRNPILLSEIPAGQPAGQEEIDGILVTLRQIAICDRPGYGLRLASLVTDDFLRRGPDWPLMMQSGSGSFSWVVGAVDGNGNPITTLNDVRELPDGRVGVLKMNELDPAYGEFTVFVHDGARWLVDETRYVAPLLNPPG
jgi:outer membrane protein assembly factor BamB